jgi:hypothetical protein
MTPRFIDWFPGSPQGSLSEHMHILTGWNSLLNQGMSQMKERFVNGLKVSLFTVQGGVTRFYFAQLGMRYIAMT